MTNPTLINDHDLIACVQHGQPVEPGDRQYTVLRSSGVSLTVWAQNQTEARHIEREYRARIQGDMNPSTSLGGVVSVQRQH